MFRDLKVRLSLYKRLILIFIVLLIAGAGAAWFIVIKPGPNPVPQYLRKQINFKVIYPANSSFDSNSWRYNSADGTLSFSAIVNNQNVIFTEQATPLAYKNDLASYNRFIGSLRPSANFDSPLGSVSIVRFITEGDFKDQGRTGILNADGTMLLAHPVSGFTDSQWQNMFYALKVVK